MTRILSLIFTVLFVSVAAFAAPEINLKKPSVFGGKYEHALNGYDVVSYYSDSGPTKGDEIFTAEYKGATWLFASAENKAKFVADPETYAPQYGGYCAWAASQGYLAAGDPKVWAIVDDKLYLNYSKSVAKDWQKDIPGFIELADAKFPELLASN